jgi:enoyl-CoA hydratase/carnithine racemase
MADLAFQTASGIGRIVFDKPPVNVFTRETILDLERAVNDAKESDIDILTIESAVEGIFSAGGDVNWIGETDPKGLYDFNARFHEVFRTIETLPMVVFALIDGHCLGGGFELALACDLRFASEAEWEIGLTEVEVGAYPGGGGPHRLMREVGPSTALELIIEGKRLSPRECLELGLVQKVFDADEFDETTHEYLTELDRGPTQAFVTAKLAIQRGHDMGIESALAYEQELARNLRRTDAYKTGHESY